ncbi:MAG: hypothetical protein MUE54_03435 [Anaerolineae bacterium]|jgi:hypothetical protein|nr:hypothetical protein [Anaerolineae bacterium]
MTLDDILRLLRHKVKIEITLSLDESEVGRYPAVCDKCGQQLGMYAHEDSAKRAVRSHRQHCPKRDEHLTDFMNFVNGKSDEHD